MGEVYLGQVVVYEQNKQLDHLLHEKMFQPFYIYVFLLQRPWLVDEILTANKHTVTRYTHTFIIAGTIIYLFIRSLSWYSHPSI